MFSVLQQVYLQTVYVLGPTASLLTNSICSRSYNKSTYKQYMFSVLQQVYLQTVYVLGPTTSLLSMLCVLIKFLSHASAKQQQKTKTKKRQKGLKVSNFGLWSFSSDIMAVKGLTCQPHRVTSGRTDRHRNRVRKVHSIRSWIVTFCQPHRVTSGPTDRQTEKQSQKGAVN